jgi:hypothetical protein
MPENKKYNASLTGEPFLFYETRQVARLKLNGLNDKEIMEEVINNNLFQYATEKSISKRVKAALKRLQVLDFNMLQYLLEKPSETAKIINLYAIMKSNRLVMEFVSEVVGEKYAANNLTLDKKDMNEFFLEKREQSEEVARWQDNTIKKLKQVLLRMLTEAGILDDRDGCTLHRPVLDPEVIRYIEAAGELNLLKAMGITI